MPNWVRTKIQAKGLGKLDIFICKQGSMPDEPEVLTIDFDKIIPSPKTKEECPEEFLLTKNEPVQPEDSKPWFDWYEWNRANWGTKWNARDWDGYETVDDEITIATAGAPPLPILVKLSEMLGDTVMMVEYHDEDDFFTPIIKMEWKNGKNTKSWLAPWDNEKEDFSDFQEIDTYIP